MEVNLIIENLFDIFSFVSLLVDIVDQSCYDRSIK